METLRLRNSGLTVSRLCMGGCPAGEFGWGNVSRAEVEKAFHDAIDNGINFFDTADTYGLGRSEETLGEAVKQRRHEVVIATKFGVNVENGHTTFNNSPRYIEKALEFSLKRLQTDYIDLYQIHYLDHITPIEESLSALMRFKEQGKIRAIGVSNLKYEDIEALRPYRGVLTSCQQHFSLAHRIDQPLIDSIISELDVTLLTWGSLGQGVLTGKYDASVKFDSGDRRSRAVYDNFHGEKLLSNLRLVEAMRPIAKRSGVPVAAVALRWILDTYPDCVAMTGVKAPAQARDNRAALGFKLSQDEMALLNELSE